MTTRTATAAIDRPYGAWESPITSKAITAGSVPLGGLRVLKNQLYWLEGRPQEGGRYVLCRYDPENPKASSRHAVDVSPSDCNIRSRVHEYGGGATVFGSSLDQVFVTDFATQQLCQLKLDSKDEEEPSLKQITPDDDPDHPHRFRFADGVVDAKGTKIFSIREDHLNSHEPSRVKNEIVSIDIATGEMQVVATGNDFYTNPRVSPDGKQLAYITWNHPNMPWDATELQVVDLTDAAKGAPTKIAGDSDSSIMQPLWHPSTNELYYLSDQDGYYNLFKAGVEESVLSMQHDFGGEAPGWSLGQQGFSFIGNRLVATYKKQGRSILLVGVPASEGSIKDVQEYDMNNGLPQMFGGIVAGPENSDDDGSTTLYLVGGSPSTPTSVYEWSLPAKSSSATKTSPAKVLACSSSLSIEEGMISTPEQIEFPTKGDRTAFAYWYRPKNSRYVCNDEGACPPLLVKAHGGPTACANTGSLNPTIQYWTSRGIAVLDVDYGGSTGYGRDYRRRLRGMWGVTDIDDACAAAEYLTTLGEADAKRLCIDGGSAGGLTTLSALATRSVFSAGCSLYGVGDLTALAKDTHKFESRYLDGLVGPYPQDEAVYKERSPIEHVEGLNCPVLLLQGDEDKIVPPNQAEMMHQALLKKGIPTCLKIYQGEQHGFRKAENIQDALDSELAFYGRVFGIDVPSAIDIEIDNL
ncbi:MAG: hypothetical protein SGILL_006045 [Bacillariaceae sp.]